MHALQSDALIGAVNAAEVLAKLVCRGMPVQDAQDAFEALHLEVTPFEPGAAAISARYVRKGVSLGDRCFLATAHQYGCGWTSDHDLPAHIGKILPPLKFFR